MMGNRSFRRSDPWVRMEMAAIFIGAKPLALQVGLVQFGMLEDPKTRACCWGLNALDQQVGTASEMHCSSLNYGRPHLIIAPATQYFRHHSIDARASLCEILVASSARAPHIGHRTIRLALSWADASVLAVNGKPPSAIGPGRRRHRP